MKNNLFELNLKIYFMYETLIFIQIEKSKKFRIIKHTKNVSRNTWYHNGFIYKFVSLFWYMNKTIIRDICI